MWNFGLPDGCLFLNTKTHNHNNNTNTYYVHKISSTVVLFVLRSSYTMILERISD